MKKNQAAKTHSKYSASSSERFISCPGSIREAMKYDASPDTEWSTEGTNAHTCLEIVQKNPGKPKAIKEFLLKTYRDEEMVRYAFETAKLIRSMVPKGATFLCETKVKLDHISKEMGGTFDAAFFTHFDRLTVIDFKYGVGVPVEAEGNLQLLMYALGLAHRESYLFTEVELIIIQPRAQHDAGPVRRWTISIEELEKYNKVFSDAYKAAEKPNAPLKAGDWCRWCPAKLGCKALSEQAFTEAQLEFSSVGNHKAPKNWSKFTPEQLSKALTAFPHIKTWIKEVEGHAKAELEKGKKIPGWKLVPSRGQRQWADVKIAKQKALSLYGADALEPSTLLSPAQLQKVFPQAKKFIEKHAIAISNGVSLVSLKDKRSSVDALERDFSEVKKTPLLTGKIKAKRKRAL